MTDQVADTRRVGTIRWFDADKKKYGFVSDGYDDTFLHISAVVSSGLEPSTLREGDRISYAIINDRKTGRRVAANIKLEE